MVGIALALALGLWQTRRAEFKVELQAQWEAARQRAPLALGAADLAPIGFDVPQRVRLRGTLLHDQTVWLDNRTIEGRPGFVVVTPLQIKGAAVVVPILRGWAARDPRRREALPAIGKPGGELVIEGLALERAPRLLELGRGAYDGSLPAIWQNLDYEAFERVSGLRAARFVVQQDNDTADGLVRAWPRPDLGADKHRAYAFQWFSLSALIAVLATVLLIRSARRTAGSEAPEPSTSHENRS